VKIICIEEHTVDMEIEKVASPYLVAAAPYIVLQTSGKALSEPRDRHRPSRIRIQDVLPLAADLGEGRISEMDAQGIQMQIVSHIAPVQLLPVEQAVALSRDANDRLARAAASKPDRLAGFAVLPWLDAQAAADELSRTVNELGFKGALIIGRPGENFLDDPRYLPVLHKFEELRVPLYVHPFFPVGEVKEAYYDGFSPMVSAEFALGAWGWHHEAGVQVLRMVLGGVFEKLPDLQVISGHWGEMVPFYLGRLDFVLKPDMTGLSRPISETYKTNVWVTPSGMFDLAQFEFIHKVLGADRIIWSTDYPYLSMDGAREFLEGLPISADEKAKIAHRNAEKLFRL